MKIIDNPERPSAISLAIAALYRRLASDLFVGTAEDLADELNVNIWTLRQAINRTREPEHIAEYGWTMPFVVRGGQSNVWRIVDTADHADEPVMLRSVRGRLTELLNTVQKNIAQCRLALIPLDPRSPEAERWIDRLADQRATQQQLTRLLETMGGRGGVE